MGSFGLEIGTSSLAVVAFGVRNKDDTAGVIEFGFPPLAPPMLIRVVTTE